MIAPEDLYILDVTEFTKDLYRMGNATWPNFSEDRARIDLIVTLENKSEMVEANGNGFSAFDHLTNIMKKPGKKVWKIKKGASLPSELRIVKDLRPGHEGHYMLAPFKRMTLEKYLKIMEGLGLDKSKVTLIKNGNTK